MPDVSVRAVTFESDGLTLAGQVRVPDDGAADAVRPAFVVLHGFGGTSHGRDAVSAAAYLGGLGYATMLFDFRGCGDSEGERGRIICLEQVRDAQNAVTFLQAQPGVAPGHVALIGSSFGGAVALYTAGVDKRIAAVVANGGWGDGERKFRGQHATPEAWQRFTGMLEAGAEAKARTEAPVMVSRFDIVPIPEHLRKALPAGSIMSFPTETAQSMFDFRANDVVGAIAPRPLLLTHAASDTVTPTEQSLELFKRAGQPADLHLLADLDHFSTYDDPRMRGVMQPWLERYFPVRPGASRS